MRIHLFILSIRQSCIFSKLIKHTFEADNFSQRKRYTLGCRDYFSANLIFDKKRPQQKIIYS